MSMNKSNKFIKKLTSAALTVAMLVTSIMTITPAAYAAGDEDIVYFQHDFEDGSIAPFKNLSVQRGGKLYVNSKYNDRNSMNNKDSRVMYLESVVYGMKAEDTVAADPADIKQDSNGWTHGFYSNRYGNLMYTDLDKPVEDAKALFKFKYYAYTPGASSTPTFGVYFSKDAAPTDVTTFATAADIESTENQALAFRLGYNDTEAYINKEIKNNYAEKDLNKTIKFAKENWIDVEFLIDMQQGSATLYLDGKKVGTSKINLNDLPRIKQIQLRMDPTDWGDHRCFIDDISLTSLPKSFSFEATPVSESEIELSSQYSIADPENLTASDFTVKSVADETEIPVREVKADGKKLVLTLSSKVSTDMPYKVVAGSDVKDIFGNNANGPASFFIAGTDLSYKTVFSDDFESKTEVESLSAADNIILKKAPKGWSRLIQTSADGGTGKFTDDGAYNLSSGIWRGVQLQKKFDTINTGVHRFSFKLKNNESNKSAQDHLNVDFNSLYGGEIAGTWIGLNRFMRIHGDGSIILWADARAENVNGTIKAAQKNFEANDERAAALQQGLVFTVELDFDTRKWSIKEGNTYLEKDMCMNPGWKFEGIQFRLTADGYGTSSYKGNWNIDDVKFESMLPKASVKDVKYIDVADNEVISDSNIAPAGITGVKMEFNGGASVKDGDVTLVGGNETIVSESFDTETAVYTAEFSAPLATETEYTLKVENCVDDTYSQSFITDSGKYEILNLNVKDGNLNYKAINTTEGNQPIFITYGVYGMDSDNVKTVKSVDSGLTDNFRGMIQGSLPVSAGSDSLVKAFAWDSAALENGMNSISKAYSSAYDGVITSDVDSSKKNADPVVYQKGDCLKIDGYNIESCVQVKITDSDNNIVYMDQADGKGDYSFSVNLGTSNAYTVDIKEDNNTGYSVPYVYLNHDTMNTAYTDLFNTTVGDKLVDYDTFKAYCETNKYALGFYSVLDTPNVNNTVFTRLYSELKASRPANATALKAMYEKCVLMANCGNSDFDNIYDYIGDYFLSANDMIKSTALQSVFDADYVTEKVQKSITAKFKAMAPKTVSEFDKDLVKAYALGVVKSANGWKNAEKALNAIASDLDLTTVKQKGAEAVIGNDYSDISDLNSAITKAQTSSGNNGGGGGGGGSIGGSGGYTSVKEIESDGNTVPPLTNEEMNAENKEIFKDLKSVDWAKDAILNLAEKGIINGKENGNFAPNDSILREEFTKIIVGAFVGDIETDINFTDVDEDAWYAPFIKRAYATGIINGISDDVFGTGMNISREDMAVIIYRAAKLKGIEFVNSDTAAFDDDGNIADYAKEAVYALKANGFVNGVSDNSFAPKQNLTRAEAAVIINRLLTAVK